MMDVPPDLPGMDSEAEAESDDEDEDQNKDVRYTLHRRDKMIVDDDGLVSDSDGEDEKPKKSARRNIANHRLSPTVKDLAGPKANGTWKSPAVADQGAQYRVAQEEDIDTVMGAPDQHMRETASDTEELTGDTVMVEVPEMPRN